MAGFESAVANVEPTALDKATAPVAHAEVREVLAADETLCEWGIDPVLIGSYRRHVSIRRINDVDVFCRLRDLPDDVTGSQALDHFYDVLAAYYGAGQVTKQDRSLNVEPDSWHGLHVDAVPARPCGSYWEIPDRKAPQSDWQETNPEGLASQSTAMNDRFNGLFVPTVKLLRQTRRAQLDGRPGGLFVEIALHTACERGLVSGSNYHDMYVSGLDGLAWVTEDMLDSGEHQLPDPSRPGEFMHFRATDSEWDAARTVFRDAANRAFEASTAERCAAARTFHDLLGKNSSGEWVYPLPSDCEPGKAAQLTVGERRVRGDDSKFSQ